MKILRFLVALVFFSGSLLAGTIDPNTKDEEYLDYATGFPFIGQFMGISSDNNPISGSVVAYKDDIILTAAHVIENSHNSLVHINNKIIKIKKHIVHEKYHTNVYGYFDIAVGLLDNSIDLKFYPELYENKDEISKICSLSGFGKSGNFKTGAVFFDNKQRAGSNKIDYIDRGLLVCTPSGHNKTALEFLIASGDSGGGLFIGNRLAGIHSCVMAVGKLSNSEYGSESGHTRISDHVTWIRDNINLLRAEANEKK